MNAIIYIRVSTTEQAELGYSLKAQEEICLEYTKRNNYEVTKIFKEKGESAKTSNRTELQNLLKYIKQNNKSIDAIIVYKLDRLSRDAYDSLSLRILFEGLGIKLKSVTEPFDNSAFGKFNANLFSILAQLDNDIRSERTIIGMKQAVKEGRWVWQAPFGYEFIKRDDKSYLVPSKEKDVVVKIFTDFINGKKQFEIIEELKKIYNISLSKQKINHILKNPVYIGKIKTNFFKDLIDS